LILSGNRTAVFRFAQNVIQGKQDCRLNSFAVFLDFYEGFIQTHRTAVFRFAQNVIQGKQDCRFSLRSKRLPKGWVYSNPYNKMLRISLGFLLLICLQKQAFDTASKQKTPSLS
jgi:hypothetical protein